MNKVRKGQTPEEQGTTLNTGRAPPVEAEIGPLNQSAAERSNGLMSASIGPQLRRERAEWFNGLISASIGHSYGVSEAAKEMARWELDTHGGWQKQAESTQHGTNIRDVLRDVQYHLPGIRWTCCKGVDWWMYNIINNTSFHVLQGDRSPKSVDQWTIFLLRAWKRQQPK